MSGFELLQRLSDWDDWAAATREAVFPAQGLGAWDPRARAALSEGELDGLWRRARGLRGAAGLAARGRLLRLLGRPGAEQALAAAVGSRGPACARLWLAECLLPSDPARALSLLRSLKTPEACFLKGLGLQLLGHWSAAADCFLEAQNGVRRPILPALLRAAALHRSGRVADALAALSTASRPGAPAAWFWIEAYSRHDAGDTDGARRAAGKALARFPELAFDWLLGARLRGACLRRAPHDERTLAWLTRAAAGPYRAFALAARGVACAYPQFVRHRQAARDLRAALALAPRAPWLHAYLGRSLGNLQDAEGARAMLDRAVALAPDCGWILAWRGCWLYRRGEAGAIKDLDRAASLSPDYPFARAWRGGALRLLGRHDEAASELALARRLEPVYEWCYAEQFQVRRAQRRWSEAASALTDAFEREPKFVWNESPENGSTAEELAEARIREPRNRLLRAWSARETLLSRGPGAASRLLGVPRRRDPAFCWFVRGEIAERAGRPGQALAAYGRAAILAPAAPYLAARGRLLLFAGRTGEAARCLQRAALLNPTIAKTLWLLAMARLAQGRLQESKSLLDRALGLHEPFADAWGLRAEIMRRVGRPILARRDAERALLLRKDQPWALYALARLSLDPVEACSLLAPALPRREELPPAFRRQLLSLARSRRGRARRLVARLLKGLRSGRLSPRALRRASPAFWNALCGTRVHQPAAGRAPE